MTERPSKEKIPKLSPEDQSFLNGMDATFDDPNFVENFEKENEEFKRNHAERLKKIEEQRLAK